MLPTKKHRQHGGGGSGTQGIAIDNAAESGALRCLYHAMKSPCGRPSIPMQTISHSSDQLRTRCNKTKQHYYDCVPVTVAGAEAGTGGGGGLLPLSGCATNTSYHGRKYTIQPSLLSPPPPAPAFKDKEEITQCILFCELAYLGQRHNKQNSPTTGAATRSIKKIMPPPYPFLLEAHLRE